MTTTLDVSKERFNSLYDKLNKIIDKIETEQDTRLQIIDRILIEILGWPRKDIKTEPHNDSGYIDYLLKIENRNRFIIEAKKISNILVDTKYNKLNSYKVNGPALKSAQDGLNQAKRYCYNTGVLFTALTTGTEWIAYWAVRTDGVPPGEGKAIVFPNLNSIKDNFAAFHDLFSREGVLNNLYQIRIHEEEGLKVSHSEPLYEIIDKKEIKLLQKSRMAIDLEQVFSGFFSAISGESDPEMLAKCFVESKESREADKGLEKITRNLINRIEIVSPDRGGELQEQIRAAVETGRGEFVLIIGNKGAGKSTFSDRFFRLVLDKYLRDKCFVIKIDLADSNGDLSTISKWLVERIKDEIEFGLFGENPPSFEQLQGMFFSEYERWRQGERKFLYKKDKIEFKIKFGEHLSTLIEKHPDKYCHRLLRDIVKSRHLMPCLVFDNTDHFPQPFQEQVFQFAQSIYRAVFSFIICPVTDRTIWQLSKSGPFQSYVTKSFYLPVPSTKDVLNKRVAFIKEKIEESQKTTGDYFLTKGIRLKISDIQAFAACIEEIFINTDYVSRIIGMLSNFDIRRGLQISQNIITSPIISIDSLVRAYFSKNDLRIPTAKIKQSLIFGDYNHFNQEHNSFIFNLFSVDHDEITSPLINLSVIRLLLDIDNESTNVEKSYMSVCDIQNYFEPLGISRSLVKNYIQKLLNYRLIDPYDPTDSEVYEDLRCKITFSGKIHYEFSMSEAVYISHMALRTGIRQEDIVVTIRDLIKYSKLQRDDWQYIISSFVEYLLREDNIFIKVPDVPSYAGQLTLRYELKGRWIKTN